jgi:hypothetical protein
VDRINLFPADTLRGPRDLADVSRGRVADLYAASAADGWRHSRSWSSARRQPHPRGQDPPDRERHADGKNSWQPTTNDSLAALVNAKTVEYEEALSKAVDKADLARRFNHTLTEG